MDYPRSGRCLCGAVEVTLNAPPFAVVACHCSHCSRTSGSAFSLVGLAMLDSVEVRGPVKAYHDVSKQGAPRERRFCSECGSPVETYAPENFDQGFTVVKLALFDSIDDFVPVVETFCERRAAWLPAFDGTAMFTEMPPVPA